MAKKTRSKCFGWYFYETNDWEGKVAKPTVSDGKNPIFSLHDGVCTASDPCFRLKLPDFATSPFSRLSWPLSNISYQVLPITSTDGNIPSQQAHQMEGAHTTTQNPMESSVARLVSMGFDRGSAMQALALTNYDVNMASNILLEAQST